jgi:hypothetical protein
LGSKDGTKIEILDPNANEDLQELRKSLGRCFLNDPFYSWLFKVMREVLKEDNVWIKRLF